ncbi:MAG TPA: hypothetical protein V6D16_14350, partial [Candidatus Obscuribacterales bacterium]
DAYIDRRFSEPLTRNIYKSKRIPSQSQSKYWLIWLAKKLDEELKTEFLIQEIQPSLLDTLSQKTIYYFATLLIFLFVYTSIGLLVTPSALFFGIPIGIAYGFTIWLMTEKSVPYLLKNFIYGLRKNTQMDKVTTLLIELIDLMILEFSQIYLIKQNEADKDLLLKAINLRLLELTRNIRKKMYGLNYEELRKIVFQILEEKARRTDDKLAKEILFSQGNVIMRYLNRIIAQREKSISPISWKDFIGSVAYVMTFTLIYILFVLVKLGSSFDLIPLSLTMFFVGILSLNADYFVRHYVLRLILFSNGNIPWNYRQFLEYGIERRLLQKVGTRYRFIHALLKDHFANMPMR